jgi:predicted 2-oxoglutarate/Fe(II)-dependent dioxygenase YbiX
MNYNLKDYCKVYKNFFNKELCTSIVSSLSTADWKLHQYYTTSGEYVSSDKELSFSYEDISQNDQLHAATWVITKEYVESLNFNWFNSWHGMTQIRFNKYDQHTAMMPHCDHIHSMFDGTRKGVPTLSIVGLLNNEFEGGEFLMWDKEKIELEAGSVMIFPSNFLYPHEVSPVLNGTRFSFVQWVW